MLFFVLDIILYQIIKIDHKKNRNWTIEQYGYNIYKPFLTNCNNTNNCFSGVNNEIPGRAPDGLEYQNTPITIFGCSFAHGTHLNYSQTFSSKLSKYLKRPVYNRGIPGDGFTGMLFQATSSTNVNAKENFFYKFVPPSDTVIYIMIDDQYRRILVDFFDHQCKEINLRYIKNKNQLKLVNSNLNIMSYLKATYVARYINHMYAQFFIANHNNAEKLTNLVLLHFLETRKALQNNWEVENINFIIIFYDYRKIPYKKLLRKKLEENNFTVIDTSEITTEDLRSEKYNMYEKDNHPNENAWNLLTPLIIKEAGL